jgi:hypothetical protein
MAIDAPCEITISNTGYLTRGNPDSPLLYAELDKELCLKSETITRSLNCSTLMLILNYSRVCHIELNGWKEKIFQRYLIWNCRPAKIRRYLRNRLPSLPLSEPLDRRRVRVAALQVKLRTLSKALFLRIWPTAGLKKLMKPAPGWLSFPNT